MRSSVLRLNLWQTSLGILGLWFLSACQTLHTPVGEGSTQPMDHSLWDRQVKRFVQADGLVEYEAWLTEQDSLRLYLADLRDNPPSDNWSEAEQLAYWINAYNAFTIELILNHYPLESIRDLHRVPVVATIWHEAWFEIGGQQMSLNHIEHKVLRKEFDEPRIHFAINCASMSCPVLRQEAYVAERLEAQLTEQAKLFLAQEERNKIQQDKVEISLIFLWFRGDFTKEGSLIEFLNQYSESLIQPDAKVSYLSYDWSLNEVRKEKADRFPVRSQIGSLSEHFVARRSR